MKSPNIGRTVNRKIKDLEGKKDENNKKAQELNSEIESFLKELHITKSNKATWTQRAKKLISDYKHTINIVNAKKFELKYDTED